MARSLDDEGLDEHDQRILEDIDKDGWHCVVIPAEGDCEGWCISVGLCQTLQQPEIAVFGCQPETGHGMLWAAVDEIREGRHLLDGDVSDRFIESYDSTFRQSKLRWYDPFFGWARWYHSGDEFAMLQVIWPDAEKRFPWEKGFADRFVRDQPLLYETDVDEARARHWLESMEIDPDSEV